MVSANVVAYEAPVPQQIAIFYAWSAMSLSTSYRNWVFNKKWPLANYGQHLGIIGHVLLKVGQPQGCLCFMNVHCCCVRASFWILLCAYVPMVTYLHSRTSCFIQLFWTE